MFVEGLNFTSSFFLLKVDVLRTKVVPIQDEITSTNDSPRDQCCTPVTLESCDDCHGNKKEGIRQRFCFEASGQSILSSTGDIHKRVIFLQNQARKSLCL